MIGIGLGSVGSWGHAPAQGQYSLFYFLLLLLTVSVSCAVITDLMYFIIFLKN